MMSFLQTFETQSKRAAVAECVFAVVLIGFADWASGYDVNFSVFYALPVIALVWVCGRLAGLGLSVFGVLAWFVGDFLDGHRYAHGWIPVWNATVRFAYLSLVVFGTFAAKRQLESSRAEVKTLKGILPICLSCKRIRDQDGYWVAIEIFLSENSEAEPSSKLCPDCSKRHYIEHVKPSGRV